MPRYRFLVAATEKILSGGRTMLQTRETLLAPSIIDDYNDADDVVSDDRENRGQSFRSR